MQFNSLTDILYVFIAGCLYGAIIYIIGYCIIEGIRYFF